MVTYFLNWMGVGSNTWYYENNIPIKERYTVWSELLQQEVPVVKYKTYYCCGRIDIHSGKMYNDEYNVPIMESESWALLGNWLNKFSSQKVISYEELIERFESETGHSIKWWSSK